MPRPKGSKNKIQRKPQKDKDAPKRGKSAFLCYLDAHLIDTKKKNPEMKHPEVISILSKQWKKLTESEQKPYMDLAHKDMERFFKEKAAYIPKEVSEEDSEDGNVKKKKSKKDENAPKRGKSAFLFYLEAHLNDYRNKNPNTRQPDAISELSKQWKNLTEEGRQPYMDKAKAAREKFLQEKDEYVAKKQKDGKRQGRDGKISKEEPNKKKKIRKENGDSTEIESDEEDDEEDDDDDEDDDESDEEDEDEEDAVSTDEEKETFEKIRERIRAEIQMV